ncbi:MAG: N4-gp56 family major capsid protein [Oscillospiraceae bacterium]|nr:N4-gp56 family major capsid protein [Oscillospiraceae bacterium]
MPEITKLENIINPEVMGDMLEAKVDALCKLTPYAKVDTTLEGVPGDTKTVPSWNYIGDAEDFDPENDDEIGITGLTATSTTFTIKCAAKCVSIYQTAINSGLGDPVGQAETQLAKSIAGKVDNDLLDAAYTASTVYAASTLATVSYDGIVEANAKFDDEEDGIDRVMFINPAMEATLLKDDDFLSADKFTAGVAVNGSIGKIAGCWIKKSKKVKLVQYEKTAEGTITIISEDSSESSTAKKLSTVQPYCQSVLTVGDKVNSLTATQQYYLCPIIKLEPDSAETEFTESELPALTIFLKKNTQVDHEWFPKKQRHDITAAKYYGTALTNSAKVVLAKFKK